MTTKTTNKAEEIVLADGTKWYVSTHIDGNKRVGVRYSYKPNRDRFLEIYTLKSGKVNIWAKTEAILKSFLKDPSNVKDMKFHKNDILQYSITVSEDMLLNAKDTKQPEPKHEEPKTNAPQTSRKGNKKGHAKTKK